MVGTRASVVYIRNLIRKHKVKDSVAVAMLTTLPQYLRQPSEKLLQELEVQMFVASFIYMYVCTCGLPLHLESYCYFSTCEQHFC